MRLINTATLKLEDFIGSQVPKYAILSHTWGEEEVSLADYTNPEQRNLAGFTKILKCCGLAKSRGHSYVWIDTCCIDKASSAELSEAINSMYAWYKESEECYAYLSDVNYSKNQETWLQEFRQSRWFTRGWTLQELLAPHHVLFFDSNWTELYSKHALKENIYAITNINEKSLLEDSGRASVAQKMSWASGRRTTRIEDEAYCLLGLFNVNMPLLYGERNKAFARLQQEIIRTVDDESIFAWTSSLQHGGMLARSPSDFAGSSRVIPNPKSPYLGRKETQMTSKGIQFESIRIRGAFADITLLNDTVHVIPICCTYEGSLSKMIVLKFMVWPHGQFSYRIEHETLSTVRVKNEHSIADESVVRETVLIAPYPTRMWNGTAVFDFRNISQPPKNWEP